MTTQKHYESISIEVIEVLAEQGFAQSGGNLYYGAPGAPGAAETDDEHDVYYM